ncbi:BTAD domain-containing putative transcriptional regulator [Roseibium sp. SCP14]|uniref:BTAD domain-containing putative transcriptional regulator n=1 Tax=Roseibium sp. SCP14 TaxID=3141375 RepID=UPI00333627EB
MSVDLLGGIQLKDGNGCECQLPTKKAALVLAVLCLKGASGVTRTLLAELIWPDRSEGQAKSSLRQALTAIRKILAHCLPEFSLEPSLDKLRLVGPDDLIDIRSFSRNANSIDPDDLAVAAVRYGGDLLENADLPVPLAEMVTPLRVQLRHQALVLVETLSRQAAPGTEQFTACEALANRLVASDPAAEEAHRALIRLRLSEGQTNAARRQLEQCSEAVRQQLGAEPEESTLALLRMAQRTGADTDQLFQSTSAQASVHLPQGRPGPSLVVMPFDTLGPEEDDFFADGVVDEITSALSRIREFFVIARQTAYTYKDRFVDARQVGQELGVRYLVEGTVRRGGDRLRITVQLVETENGTQLWSDRFEGDLSEQFELQDHIASRVAGAIHPSIRASEIDIARRTKPENQQAYDFVMRALPHFWAHRDEGNRKALALLDKALERDPDYGVALAYKAWCHAQQACYLWSENPKRDKSLAISTANQAALCVSDHAAALTAIGAAYTIASTDRELAESFILRSLDMDPNNAWGWMRLGWLGVLFNRTENSHECFRKSIELSPRDPFLFNVYFGMSAAHARENDLPKAIELAEKGLRAGPGVTWAYRMLAAYCARHGDEKKSKYAIEKLIEHNPGLTMERLRAGLPQGYVLSDPEYFEILSGIGLPEK